jgi:hypothetical protein
MVRRGPDALGARARLDPGATRAAPAAAVRIPAQLLEGTGMASHGTIGARLGMGALLFLASECAYAQSQRTWVSSLGDDINACSNTLPCRTFTGAAAKTNPGGVISVLDPGSFGAVVLSQSVTIQGAAGMESGILAAGVSGVTVNGAGINVVLRNLQIHGNNPAAGLNGVRFQNGASLLIDNCDIQGFHAASAGNGVLVDPTAAGTYRLYISNSRIYENGAGSEGGGVRIKPTGASTFVFATIRDTEILNNNGYGVLSRDRSFVSITDSSISGNLRSGVHLLTTGTIGDTLVRDSFLVDNGSVNAGSEASVTANGATAFVTLVGNTIAQSENGTRRLNGGHIASSGDNRMVGNTANGTSDGAVTSF